MVKTQKFKDRRLDSSMNRLAKSVGTTTSGAVDAELNLMLKFTLEKILDSASIISSEYAKQKSETVKPSLLQAAFMASLHGDFKEAVCDKAANAAIAFQQMKKAGGIRKAKKAREAAAASDAEVSA